MNKAASPKGVIHTCLCLSTMPGLLGEASLISQQSLTQVTRGGVWGPLLDRHKQSECPARSPSHWHPQMEKRVVVSSRWLQWWHASCGVKVQQGCTRAPWHSQARPAGGQSSEFLQTARGIGPTHIGVQMDSLSKCSDLWFWVSGHPPKSILITPHDPMISA